MQYKCCKYRNLCDKTEHITGKTPSSRERLKRNKQHTFAEIGPRRCSLIPALHISCTSAGNGPKWRCANWSEGRKRSLENLTTLIKRRVRTFEASRFNYCQLPFVHFDALLYARKILTSSDIKSLSVLITRACQGPECLAASCAQSQPAQCTRQVPCLEGGRQGRRHSSDRHGSFATMYTLASDARSF